MKHLSLNLLALFMCSAAATHAGSSYIVDGIVYSSAGDNEVQVCPASDGVTYSGDISIPDVIDIDGVSHKVVGIAGYAFSGTPITSIALPESIKYIGDGAFQWSAIESVTLPANIRSIPYRCFYEADSLKDITLPAGIVSIDECAFQNCDNLTTVNISSTNLRIVRESAFEQCKKLTSISLPDALIIGRSAFSDCTALKEIILSDNLERLEYATFMNCKSLTAFDIPASVKTIEASAFKYCKGLLEISGGESLDSIHADAFYDCNFIASLPDMKNLEYVGDRAFLACSEFDWQLPEGLKYVGDQAFFVCNRLKSQLPSTLEHIGECAFMSCEMPSYLIIPDATTHIGERAFERCGEIDSISFGSGLREIPEGAFSYITACVGKIVDTQRWYEFNGALENLKIPDNIEIIGKKAFDGCPKLESIEIGNGVYEIGKDAFGGHSPKKISFGKALTKIGARALYFSRCDEVTCLSPIPPVFGKEIPDSVYTATLIVPKGSLELYKSSPTWKNFINIIESEEDAATTETVKTVRSNDMGINISGNTVYISNTGCDIAICDIYGHTVYHGRPARITLPAGIYILRANDTTRKFMIKQF